MIKRLTEPKPGYIVLNDTLRECFYWRESRYERVAPNDDDWVERNMYSLHNPPKGLYDEREGNGYSTKEEAIEAHNNYINQLIEHYKKKLL